MLNTKGLTMPEARFKAADGSIVKVQLPNTKLQFGAVHYDEKTHKGKLMCKCCDAPVHFHPGSQTVSGDNLRGPRPHFSSNRQAYHGKDCTVELAIDEGRDPRDYDLTKGYRFHMNTGELKQQFDGRARPYGRRSYPHWEIIINDSDLKDREPYSFMDAENLQRLIGKKRDDRVADAVIVNGGSKIPMRDFFFRYVRKDNEEKRYSRKQPDFLRLVDQLQEFGDHQLIAMEIDLATPRYAKGKVVCAEGHPIKDRKKDADGYTHEIIPRVMAGYGAGHAELARMLGAKERLLVVGIARMRTEKDEEAQKVRHFVEVAVRQPQWVSRVILNEDNKLTQRKSSAPFPQVPLPF